MKLVIEGSYLDAVLIFLYVFIRFYTGNVYNAEQLAEEYNQTKNSDSFQRIMDALIEYELTLQTGLE